MAAVGVAAVVSVKDARVICLVGGLNNYCSSPSIVSITLINVILK